jgi:hypothetical protein
VLLFQPHASYDLRNRWIFCAICGIKSRWRNKDIWLDLSEKNNECGSRSYTKRDEVEGADRGGIGKLAMANLLDGSKVAPLTAALHCARSNRPLPATSGVSSQANHRIDVR